MNSLRIGDLLPRAMADDEFTARFVSIFDVLKSDVVARVAGVEAYFDPTIAPLGFVRMLAGWTNLPLPGAWEDDIVDADERARNYVTDASPLFRWRGTRRGLESLLAAATGCDVTVQDAAAVFVDGEEPAEPTTGPVRIRFHGSTPRLPRFQIDVLVRSQLPVGVTYEIVSDEDEALDG